MFSDVFKLITTILCIVIFVPYIWTFQKIIQIKKAICRFCLSVTLLMIFVPIIIFILLWSLFYRSTVHLILWLYHNGRYATMLNGCNRIYAVQESSPHIILFLIKYENQPFDFYQKMSHTIKNALKGKFNQKVVFSTLHSFLGYDYFLIHETSYTEYIKPLPSIVDYEMDNSALLDAIEKHAYDELPRSNTGLWDISIGMQEIKWKTTNEANGEYFYPIVLRVHPCVSNVFDIINTVLNVSFVEAKSGAYSEMNCISLFENIQNGITQIFRIFITPAICFWKILASLNESKIENFLHDQMLCHKKTYLVNDESASENIRMIENIKAKFPGTTFQDIIIAAFAASFETYYSEVSEGNLVSKSGEKLVYKNHRTELKEDPSSRSSQVMLKLPIQCKAERVPIKNTLETMKYQRMKMAGNIETKVYDQILDVFFTYLPSPFLRIIISQFKYTTFISNIPGLMTLRKIDDYVISHLYAWTPHRGNTGISLTIATYDKRLQLSLCVDKVLIENKEDVRRILNGIYANLNELYNTEVK